MKKINYRHFICIFFTLLFIILAILVFPYALARIGESFVDLWNSLKFYFCELFLDDSSITPTITNLSKVPFKMPFNLPSSWEELKIDFNIYMKLFWSKENFNYYLLFLSDCLYWLSFVLLLITPVFMALFYLFKKIMSSENNDYNKESKSLIIYKKFVKKYCYPIKRWFEAFYNFLIKNSYYYKIWIITWCYSFNIFAIGISFVSFYLYFIVSFDLAGIIRQFFKLMFDLSSMINYIPVPIWIIIGLFVFDFIRKKIAYARLHHWEMKNRGFINSLPIVVMGCGTMGSKKTTMITDMGLSQEVMFRDKAFEKILENDLKFPDFPWINLENILKQAFKNHIVYSLATCRKFISELRYYFDIKTDIPCCKAIRRHLKKKYGINYYNNLLFDYDYNRYGLTYDDKLKVSDVWDIIKVYSELYYIYVITSSLMIANYSIRTDNILSDLGNFPLWDTDFFKRDSRLMDSYSRHSHILDFDTLRLGKKVLENNPFADAFEFGIVLITEVGKERGNTLELSDKKKTSLLANQKNDLFDSELKMIRHSATIDNTPFVRVFTDEQRPESWGANARDLCNILHMEQSSELSLAMPFFELEELFYNLLYNKFSSLYYEYRYNRGDNTLSMYLYKSIMAKIHHYYKSLYNRFGYMRMEILIEKGTQDEEPKSYKYNLMVKKIYSKRFSTDCHSGFFQKKALRSDYGLNDIPEYAGDTATAEELNSQQSYFINDLNSGLEEYEKLK